MSIYDRVQMIKRGSCCEGMEDSENHVGSSDVKMECGKSDDLIGKIVPGHLGKDESTMDRPAVKGSVKTTTTKVIGVKKDDSPMIMRVVHTSDGGPIEGSNDVDGPSTVRVGQDSIESLGRALNILKQLKFPG